MLEVSNYRLTFNPTINQLRNKRIAQLPKIVEAAFDPYEGIYIVNFEQGKLRVPKDVFEGSYVKTSDF